jgi:hypothetical protein
MRGKWVDVGEIEGEGVERGREDNLGNLDSK